MCVLKLFLTIEVVCNEILVLSAPKFYVTLKSRPKPRFFKYSIYKMTQTQGLSLLTFSLGLLVIWICVLQASSVGLLCYCQRQHGPLFDHPSHERSKTGEQKMSDTSLALGK